MKPHADSALSFVCILVSDMLTHLLRCPQSGCLAFGGLVTKRWNDKICLLLVGMVISELAGLGCKPEPMRIDSDAIQRSIRLDGCQKSGAPLGNECYRVWMFMAVKCGVSVSRAAW